MNPHWLARTVVLVFALSLTLGCKKKDTGTDDSTTNPPVGTVDDSAGFYIRYITNSKYTYDLHKDDTGYGTSCTAVAGEQNYCYLEAEELDLYFNGVSLQYNVPSTLCSYVVWSPYYFLNFATGDGPTLVQQDTDKNGDVGVDNNIAGGDGVIDSAAADCSSGVFDFDHSSLDPPGPNCCTGTYTLVTRAWDAAANAGAGAYSPAVTTPNVPWGGSAANCIYGPAVDTQPKSAANFPLNDIYYVDGSGLNKKYDIAAPISKVLGTNVYAANYFSGSDHAGGLYAGYLQPYYSAYCLDRSHEVKAALHVMIRDWNTSSAFTARTTSPANHSIGNICTLTPLTCTSTDLETTPFGTFRINDYSDWKDFVNSYPEIR